MPKTSVRVQVEDFKAQAVAEHRRSEERVSQGDPGEDKPDGAEGHEGERLARASVSSGEEVADATAHTTGRQDVSQEAEEKQATASKGAEKREQGKWKDVRFERVGSQEDTSDNPEGRQSRRKTAAGYSLEHRSKSLRRGQCRAVAFGAPSDTETTFLRWDGHLFCEWLIVEGNSPVSSIVREKV